MNRKPLKTMSTKRRAAERVLAQNRKAALLRDGFQCQAVDVFPHECGGGLILHHVRLRSQGGGHEVENLLTLCDAAHLLVHANPAVAKAHGLIEGVA